jgi:hypothetical protein
MKRILTAIAAFFIVAPALSLAQTVCANPAQAAPNFSGNGPGADGSYNLAAGATLPVVWTPSSTLGCITYYTVDGSTPTSSSPVYTGQTIQLSQTTVILMIAEGPGFADSTQEGGEWVITVTGTTAPAGAVVKLSCAPSAASTSANPGTTSLFKATAPSTTYSLLASGLPPACTYADTVTAAGATYSYYAEAVINGETSVPSNTFSVTIPSGATAPAVSVSFSPAAINNATAVVATIKVSGSPAPTGSVTLASGAYTSAATTLVNGAATITIPANSLDVGSLSFTATYTPDTASAPTYASATGTGTLPVTPVPPSALAGTVSGTVAD